MSLLDKILSFFGKKNNHKMLMEATEQRSRRTNFQEELKVQSHDIKRKSRVETRICVGDGLGISKGLKF